MRAAKDRLVELRERIAAGRTRYGTARLEMTRAAADFMVRGKPRITIL
jgi:hypothetical protein